MSRLDISTCHDGLYHQRTLKPHSIYIWYCNKCGQSMDMWRSYTEHGTPLTWYDLAFRIKEWP